MLHLQTGGKQNLAGPWKNVKAGWQVWHLSATSKSSAEQPRCPVRLDWPQMTIPAHWAVSLVSAASNIRSQVKLTTNNRIGKTLRWNSIRWVGESAQFVKCCGTNMRTYVSSLRNHVEGKAKHHGMCPWPQHRGGEDRTIPVVCWPTSVAELATSRFRERLCLKQYDREQLRKTSDIWPPHICTHMHLQTQACISAPLLPPHKELKMLGSNDVVEPSRSFLRYASFPRTN